MNKQTVASNTIASNSAANISKNMTQNTLQELWMIKDETADKFNSVPAYFEHLRVAQTMRAKAGKGAPSNARKAQIILKTRRTVGAH